MGRILTVLAVTWLACTNIPAMGEEVTFTESATASGSLDGHSFASSSMTITAVADPSNWVYHVPDVWTNEFISARVTVAAVGSDNLNNLVWYISWNGIPDGGTYDLFTTVNDEMMTVLEFYVPWSDDPLPGYTTESVGPVSCQPLYHYPHGGMFGATQCESEFDFYDGLYGNVAAEISTDSGGSLIITSASNLVYSQVVGSASEPVPEPPGLLLLASGLLGLVTYSGSRRFARGT